MLATYSVLNVLELLISRTKSVKPADTGHFTKHQADCVYYRGAVFTSILIGKSPVILLSGLGAMTAVFMLVFKDPILGLVAGIKLSAYKMLSVGDWLEMPKYGADGSVIDIN